MYRGLLFLFFIFVSLFSGALSSKASASMVSVSNIAINNPSNSEIYLNQLITEGLQGSPRLEQLYHQLTSAREGGVIAESLPDPKVSFVFNNYPVDSFAADETPMTGKVLKFSQAIPFPTKLSLKSQIAHDIAVVADDLLLEEGLKLRRDIVKAWNQLQLKREVLALTEKKFAALDEFLRFIESRYAVGKGGQQDVLNVQVARTRVMNKLSTVRQGVQGATLTLNRLLNRHDHTYQLFPLESFPLIKSSTTAESSADNSDLFLQLKKNRPIFHAYQQKLAAGAKKVELSDAARYPDFSFGAGYTYREESSMYDSTDFATVEIGMTLPIFSGKRNSALRRAAVAGLKGVESSYLDLIINEESILNDLLQQQTETKSRIVMYDEGIIPQAYQRYQASLIAYQVGTYEFSSLLRNLLTQYDAEIEQRQVVAQLNSIVAELRYRLGLARADVEKILLHRLDGSDE